MSFFCGYDQDVKEISITDKTISIHHYSGTWYKKNLKHKAQILIKRIFGVENYRKLLNIKRSIISNLNNKRGLK